ncbi:MAG TPA: hypothetical protein VFE05_02475 [Longimicrobiaceae bacterium]|jgi:hypothetical protein|nr:hypothetical protein [Longimicrobiaceae bacterium]
MRKLRLDIEDIGVESFETAEKPWVAPGTVEGYRTPSLTRQVSCFSDCPATQCGNTCYPNYDPCNTNVDCSADCISVAHCVSDNGSCPCQITEAATCLC